MAAIMIAMRTVVTADRLWDGRRLLVDRPMVEIEDGRIRSVGACGSADLPPGVQVIEFRGALLGPAFFDVHIHGAAGHDVMEATPEALDAIDSFLALRGTGSYLATTVTAPLDRTLRALEGLARHIAREPEEGRARPIGVHLEGPFLSHSRRGVHPPELLLAPDVNLFDRLFDAAEGRIRLLTLAPELPGARELVEHATARGVRVSLGHSNATAEETEIAIAAGAVSGTHTFNAMRPLDHREPGILGTVLTRDALYAELICDGVHTVPEMVLLWWRAKGPGRAILVTDAMSATGMPDGEYMLGDLSVQVSEGKATSGGVLAGSVLTLDRALLNLVKFTGARIEDAIRPLTSNPAAMTGLEDCAGTLAPGRPANLVALGATGRVIGSLIGGRPVFSH